MRQLINLLRNNARKGEFRAEGNTLYIYDVIVSSKADAEWLGGSDAETFIQALNALEGDVSVRVNSPGGDVFAGRAMAQAIADYPGAVTCFVDGYAASAASLVTAAADRVVMGEGAFQMIHNAWTISVGNASDLMQTAALLEKIDGTIADTYAGASERRGVSIDAAGFADLMTKETWLTGQEAIDAGLADEIATKSVKNKVAWDLSVYHSAPEIPDEPQNEADPIVEPAPEIEQPRPNFAADMLFRPAP